MSDISKRSKTLKTLMPKFGNNQAIDVIVQLKSLEQNGKEQKKNSKKEMLSFIHRLEELKKRGERITYKPYEALSSVYVKAQPDIIMELTSCEEVLEIIEDQTVKLIGHIEKADYLTSGIFPKNRS